MVQVTRWTVLVSTLVLFSFWLALTTYSNSEPRPLVVNLRVNV